MAYVLEYQGKRGVSYRGYYRDADGKRTSVGTFATHDEAMQVASDQELWIKGQQERTSPQRLATVTFREYVPQYLRLANVEDVTRAWYAGLLNRHVIPRFGDMRVAEITPEQVAHWLVDKREAGYGSRSLQAMRTALSAVLTQAASFGYARGNAASRSPIPRLHQDDIIVVTQEQFNIIWQKLPTEGMRVYAELVVFTGMRQGEAMALTPADIDFTARTILLRKAWTEPGRENNTLNKGERFRLNPHTKGGKKRKIAVKANVLAKLMAWITKNNIGPNDMIFTKTNMHAGMAKRTHSRGRKYYEPLTPERIASLGTFIGPNGKEYQHGTINGYASGKDKCPACRQASSEYSAIRKAIRNNQPVPDFSKIADKAVASPANTNPRDVMGRAEIRALWQDALAKSGLDVEVKASQLRHTHASWMVKHFGATPQDMCHRLGHADLEITARYITQVGDAADNDVADRMELDLTLDLVIA